MKLISSIPLVKEAYVVTINDILHIFTSKRGAESYLIEEKYDEWYEAWENGFIATPECHDVTRYYGIYYMKLTDYVASLNELEAKMALLNLFMQMPPESISSTED